MNEEEPLDTDAADVAMIAQGLAPLEQAVTPASPFGLFGDSLAASAGGSDTGPPADSPGMPVALTTSELVSLGTAVSMGNLTVDAARAFLGVRFGIDPATAAELIPDSIEAGQGEEEPPALPPGQDDDDDDDEEMSLRVMVWDVKSAEVDGDPAKDGNWAISSDPFATSLRKQQDAQSEELLSALDGLLAPTAEMVGTIIGPDDMARWSAETQRAARPHLTDIVDGSGDKAVRDMVGMVDVDLDVGFNVQNPEVVRWITAEGRVIGTGTTRTYASQIARTLGEGVGRGESIGELQKRIEDIASDFTPASAERIARTETAYGFMHGQREGWKQSGVVVGKKWLLAPNPCPFCAATSAKFNSAKNINEPFYTFGTRIAAQFTRING